MIRAKARLLPLFLATGLAACSSAGTYPSLAIRPVERATPVVQNPSATPVPLPPPSADTVTRINGLLASAREADSQFAARRTAAERAVSAAGSSTGSDSWLSAQVAVSALQASRDPSIAALAELDTMFATARDASPNEESPTTKSIAAARDEVQASVTAQDEVVSRLNARLGT
ncbi:hypothetical protein [Novosphingobium sp. PhB165]|uniref:hypothetical protein n=1 Tax=Novosphingobium sp. PhB165 TaxID=2485105 RepID=UPI0010477E35|nr:hypothetical protein [Novosphingobium sp. PhB165]